MKTEIVNVDEIEEIIIAYANGELHKRLPISEKFDERDTIISGINMLGEELEKTTISRNYFMNIFNSVSEILIFMDSEGKIKDINNTSEKLLDCKLEDLIGKDIREIIGVDFLPLENSIKYLLKSDEKFIPFETTIKINPKKEIPVSCVFSKVLDKYDNLKGYLFIANDITDKKNRELNELKISIAAQEKERKRLAHDIHDSLGQELNAIKMYMNSLAVMDPACSEFSSAFETCKLILDNSLDNIRNISFDLMPKALENGGLLHALIELVNRLKMVTTIEYNFQNINTNFKKDIQINIFRVVQEFINNSLKHAHHSKIELKANYVNGVLTMYLKDNGIGFNINKVKVGNGILNIKTRLNALNAKYTFDSAKNKGTILEFSIIE